MRTLTVSPALHSAFVNALTLLLIALRADNYFRTEMGSGYEKGLQNELNLVDRIESSLVCFEEVCEIPVLLSLFIIVLDAPKWQLPEGIGHLYRLAIDCVAFKFTNSVNSTSPSRRNTWNPKEIGSVRYPIADVFSRIACANHANAGQRIFDTAILEQALGGHDDLIEAWEKLSHLPSPPLVKVIMEPKPANGDAYVGPRISRNGLYQFKHLRCVCPPLHPT